MPRRVNPTSMAVESTPRPQATTRGGWGLLTLFCQLDLLAGADALYQVPRLARLGGDRLADMLGPGGGLLGGHARGPFEQLPGTTEQDPALHSVLDGHRSDANESAPPRGAAGRGRPTALP